MTKGCDVPEQEPKLVFDIPSSETRGFIRRQREAIRHREALRSSPSVATMDAMIDFLLTFVSEPADRDAARELMLDMSRDDYNRTLSAVMQEDADFLQTSTASVSSSRRG